MATRLNILPTATPPTPDLSGLSVGLVNMPLSTCRGPSIQLGLLQAIARRHGVEAECHYLNMAFAQRIGWELAERLCLRSAEYLLGDWLFSVAAFGEDAPASTRYDAAFPGYVDLIAERVGLAGDVLRRFRSEHAPQFIEACLEETDWGAYDVVGFTSVFCQNTAALALARRIKERHPETLIVFGGANFEGELGREYVRSLPWVDYAVCGEGDIAFVDLLAHVAGGDPEAEIPGVARRTEHGVSFPGPAASVRDMDGLPTPDYDDYFRAADRLGLPDTVVGCEVVLPIETARGCWWGAKHQCTFCGIFDEQGMAYRSKSPARVVQDVHALTQRYGVRSFAATDLILDPRYVEGVFGTFDRDRDDYRFFYELKSNMRPEQLRALRRGGLINAQPGIESLNTHVLQLMDKGVTAIQNVRLLKWATYYGIDLTWRILRGFPGERPEDYEAQIGLIDAIGHLQAPDGRSVRIFLEKFSPHFDRAAEFGFDNVRPCQSYACVYPKHLALDRIARTFDYERGEDLPTDLVERLDAAIGRWCAGWRGERPTLQFRVGPGEIEIVDRRDPLHPTTTMFRGAAAVAYRACTRTYRNLSATTDAVREAGLAVDRDAVADILDGFVDQRLMFHEGGRYLGLALPANAHW